MPLGTVTLCHGPKSCAAPSAWPKKVCSLERSSAENWRTESHVTCAVPAALSHATARATTVEGLEIWLQWWVF